MTRAPTSLPKAAGVATALFLSEEHNRFHSFDELRATEPDHVFADHTELPALLGLPYTSRVHTEVMTMKTETAILAGGCFWGMQDLIRKLPGVMSTRVGYSGGDVPTRHVPQSRHARGGDRGRLRSRQLSYRELLEFFFQIHDPTTKNRQGNDSGTSYRSGIYYLSDEQRPSPRTRSPTSNASGSGPGAS